MVQFGSYRYATGNAYPAALTKFNLCICIQCDKRKKQSNKYEARQSKLDISASFEPLMSDSACGKNSYCM